MGVVYESHITWSTILDRTLDVFSSPEELLDIASIPSGKRSDVLIWRSAQSGSITKTTSEKRAVALTASATSIRRAKSRHKPNNTSVSLWYPVLLRRLLP